MVTNRRSVPALMDVARLAGVGAGTVSRVINGGQNVSSKTLATVQWAIEELGYHPSHAARSLKGARSKTIGLIIPSVADPFFSAAAAAIQVVARAHDSLVLLAASDNLPQREREQVTALIQRRIDGLILAPSDAADIDVLQDAGFPVVCFDRPFPGNALPTVLGDNYGGAKGATQHLVDQGYKRILCMGGDARLFTSQMRVRGHRDVVYAARLPYFAELDVHDYTSAEAALERHLAGSEQIDAVFCIKNELTMNVYRILRQRGVRVPEAMALLGYDDFELADTLEPPVTVIRQPVEEIARCAAVMLFEALEAGSHAPLTSSLTLRVELVPRGSCGELLQAERIAAVKAGLASAK
jgi:LacI family transcriptional regulator